MDVKWFFVIVGIILAFAILVGMFFIGSYISLQSDQNADKQIAVSTDNYNKAMNQSKAQYEKQLNQSMSNFNNSVIIHDALYNNITDITKGLKPILAVIPNATQSELDRQIHYNQTSQDFETIKELMEIKLLDHETLDQINQTVNELAGKNVSSTATPPSNSSIISACDDTSVIIENITGKEENNLTNKLPQPQQQC